MPRVARFKIAAIENLYRQLLYAPLEKRKSQMNAAELLTDDIDPTQNYPEDFVVFRITGYRPQLNKVPLTLVGEALLPDLINLVQRLSDDLELPPDYDGRSPVLIPETAQKLNISTKTVQRYRKQGLVSHYVVYPDQEKRLVCFEDAIDRFIKRHQKRLERASRFTRLGEGIEAQIIKEARDLHEAEGISLNEAAARLATKHNRAHETLRLILKRHDRRASASIFDEPGPLSQRDLKVIFRAWKIGVPVAELARRFDKGAPAIHRAINRRRYELLRKIDLKWIELPTFELEDATIVLLSGPAVIRDLDQVLPDDEALRIIECIRGTEPLEESEIDGLVAGYNFLKRRASRTLSNISESPNSQQLDRIESDLRWTALLKRRLVSTTLPFAFGVVEQTIHRPLAQQPADEIVSLIEMAIEVVSRSVENHDPTRKGERLDRFCAHAMGRAMAALYETKSSGRAAARHAEGIIPLDHPFSRLCPWQAWLDPRRDMLEKRISLKEEDRQFIALRYGLEGGPPHDLDTLATMLDSSIPRLSRRLQRLERVMRERVRGEQA
ncbi:MAG: hypothetical protein O7G85_04380 [Planctomycetota bacterium]|nr:hypothetical protein [Planctomycetota bacterium]